MKKHIIQFIISGDEKESMLLVEGFVDSTSGFFIIDTGASATIVDSSVISPQQDNNNEELFWELKGLEGIKKQVFQIKIESLKIGSLNIDDTQIFCTNLSILKQEFDKKVILGIVGNDLLRKFKAEINFEKQTISLTKRV